MTQSQSGYSAPYTLPRLLLGAYAWLYAVCLGLVVLDGVYARALRADQDPAVVNRIFIEISDFLLLPYATLGLAGGLVLLVGWRLRVIRTLVPISLVLPVLAMAAAAAFGAALDAASLGGAIRLLTFLSGSVLALLGLIRLPA